MKLCFRYKTHCGRTNINPITFCSWFDQFLPIYHDTFHKPGCLVIMKWGLQFGTDTEAAYLPDIINSSQLENDKFNQSEEDNQTRMIPAWALASKICLKYHKIWKHMWVTSSSPEFLRCTPVDTFGLNFVDHSYYRNFMDNADSFLQWSLQSPL